MTYRFDCKCLFIGPNQPMKHNRCKVHNAKPYSCDECGCTNYKPRRAPVKRQDGLGFHWSLCACGHPAQDHNQRKGE